MKKFCYLLSIAGHAAALLIVLGVDFPITIQPEPSRVTIVTIAEPPLPLVADNLSAGLTPKNSSPAAAMAIDGARSAAGMTSGTGAGPSSPRSVPSFPVTGAFSLKSSASGSFHLAPVGKNPDPWAIPIGPALAARRLSYPGGVFSPVAAASRPGISGGVFLLPFDIREKAVSDWTEAALARIERNWTVPVSARFAFAGRVQITLTIEKDGHRRALVIDDSTLPEPLTRTALHAVEASLPLPPLPDNIAGETFVFTFVFTYNG